MIAMMMSDDIKWMLWTKNLFINQWNISPEEDGNGADDSCIKKTWRKCEKLSRLASNSQS